MSPREAALAGVWEELLGRAAIERTDRFLDVGGDSLRAVELVARVADVFGVDLPLTAPLDAAPTIAAMAEMIDQRHAAGRQRPVALDWSATALSPAQERMWVLQQLDPASSAYNVPMALRLRGPLAVDALRRALTEIVERHDVLHSRFLADEGQPQLVLDAPAFVVDERDMSADASPVDAALRAAADLCARPFDLTGGPVVRAALYRVAIDDHLLITVFHHIATDASSREVIRDELAALYPAYRDGASSPLSPIA